MGRMALPIALPLVGAELATASRHVVGNGATARPHVSRSDRVRDAVAESTAACMAHPILVPVAPWTRPW
jgi:hypothetical protein